MNTAIIVCDAWAKALPQDLIDYPTLEEEIRVFSQYLNYVIDHERRRGTRIIHDPTNREIVDVIRTEGDTVLEWHRSGDRYYTTLPGDCDRFLICGFHYGRCIWNKLDTFSRCVPEHCELGAIINLSHWLFRDRVEDQADRMADFDNYIWTPRQISPVLITPRNST